MKAQISLSLSAVAAISRSHQYCRQADSRLFGNCYAQLPHTDTPVCTAPQGDADNILCECDPSNIDTLGCDTEVNGASANYANYRIAYCTERITYISEQDERRSFCKQQQVANGFPTRPSNRPLGNGNSWWWCGWGWSDYEWHEGRCVDTTRFLGERCGDEWGICKNDAEPYHKDRLSCYESDDMSEPRCIPSNRAGIERNSCDYQWVSWYVFVARGSNNCNGHACVFSTGPGGWMCDYHTGNNW